MYVYILLAVILFDPGVSSQDVGIRSSFCCNNSSSCSKFIIDVSALGKDKLKLETLNTVLKKREMIGINYHYSNDKFDMVITPEADSGYIFALKIELFVIEACGKDEYYLKKLDLEHLVYEDEIRAQGIKGDTGTEQEARKPLSITKYPPLYPWWPCPYCCTYENGIVSFRRTISPLPISGSYAECKQICSADFLCIGWSFKTTGICQLNRFFIFLLPGVYSGPIPLSSACDRYSKRCLPDANAQNTKIYLSLTSITVTSSPYQCALQCCYSNICVRWFWLPVFSFGGLCFRYKEVYPTVPGWYAGTKPCP